MKKYRYEVLVLIGGVLFYALFNWLLPITDPVESNYALTAKEMLQSGDYLSMRIYGAYWYDKPIFIYWSLILSYKIFGINAFAARFPMALASALSLSFMYWFTVRLYAKRTALLCTGILATSLAFWIIGKIILTDAWLFLFDSAGLAFFYLALREQRQRWYLAAYAAFALAVLTKGPVGIVLPGLIILAYFLCARVPRCWKSLYFWRGMALFSCLALPWYLYMYAVHGTDFINGFLGLHNFTRATVSEHPQANVFYYYLLIIPLYCLPWSALLVQSIYRFWQARVKEPADIFYFCWLAVTTVFYSLMATKYPTYVFIVLFPVAILMARHVAQQLETAANSRWCLWVSIPFLAFLVLLFVAVGWLGSGMDNAAVYLLAGTIFIAILYLQWRGRSTAIIGGIMLGVCLLVVGLSCTALPKLAALRSLNLTEHVAVGPAVLIGIYSDYSTAAVFYGNQPIVRVEDQRSQQDAWSGKYTMPRQLWSEFEAAAPQRDVYLIVRQEHAAAFLHKNLAAHYQLLYQENHYLIYRKI